MPGMPGTSLSLGQQSSYPGIAWAAPARNQDSIPINFREREQTLAKSIQRQFPSVTNPQFCDDPFDVYPGSHWVINKSSPIHITLKYISKVYRIRRPDRSTDSRDRMFNIKMDTSRACLFLPTQNTCAFLSQHRRRRGKLTVFPNTIAGSMLVQQNPLVHNKKAK